MMTVIKNIFNMKRMTRFFPGNGIPAWRILLSLSLVSLFVMVPIETDPAESAQPTAKERQDLDFADGLYQRGMYENAARQYEEFLKRHSTSSFREIATFRQGESLYQHASKQREGDPQTSNLTLIKARAIFKNLIDTFQQGEKIQEALLRYGEISYTLGDAKTGLNSLERVIKESKDSAILEAALFYSARSYENLAQNKKAEEQYRRIIATYPKGEYTAFATYLLAEVLAKEDRAKEAGDLLNDLWKNSSKYKFPKGSKILEDAQLRSAQILYQMDRFADASKAYQAYVDAHPNGKEAAKAKYGAAWAEYRQKNYARALAIAETLQRQSLPPDLLAGILFLKGTCSYQQKEYPGAILYFREVIADPNAGEYRERAWYQLAWSYYLSSQYGRAMAECQSLLQKNLSPSMSGNVHFLLGQTYSQQQDYDNAISEMQLVLRIDPNGEYAEEALFLMADLHYRQEEYALAATAFERYYDTYSKSDRAQEALVWAANSRFAGKDYEGAVSTADRLLHAYPNLATKPDVLYRKALAHYQLKNYDDSFLAFAEILAISGQDQRKSEALYWQAYIKEIQKQKKEASALYARLLNSYPNFKNRDEVQLRKALCDYQTKDYEIAYEEFLTVLFTDKGTQLPAEIIFWMIFKADELGKHEEALRIAQRVQATFEHEAIRERAIIAIGNQLAALKRWKETRTNGDAFLKAYPESLFKPEIYWSLGKASEGLNQRDKALEWFEKSLLELQQMGNPDPLFEATLYMDRGRLFESLDQTGKALESFLRVAIIYDHPELTPEAMVRSVQCHLVLNEKSEAKTMYDELFVRYRNSSWAKKAKEKWLDVLGEPPEPDNENQ